ncbi:MAG: type II 3-dehydroquinate dehydratase [Oscillospiraceae bacterium]|nr:type II 3-dehydroquinate dehydratase [Oscillospiraceae bacterium]
MKKILIMNGPNLNLLGVREPGIYGGDSLSSINEEIRKKAEEKGMETDFFQSNHEGELIDRLHAAMGKYDGIIFNAGAYTHYSYAIRDAIAAIKVPVIEVHISNVHTREEFRHKSVISPVCVGVVAGLGKKSYICALEYFA